MKIIKNPGGYSFDHSPVNKKNNRAIDHNTHILDIRKLVKNEFFEQFSANFKAYGTSLLPTSEFGNRNKTMSALEGSNNNKLVHSSFRIKENMLHASTKQEDTTSTSGASSRLMAVDDEADITFTLKKELEQSGFSLDVFNDPTTALANFKAEYYDLILLDVKMPEMNGFELYQEIKNCIRSVL